MSNLIIKSEFSQFELRCGKLLIKKIDELRVLINDHLSSYNSAINSLLKRLPVAGDALNKMRFAY